MNFPKIEFIVAKQWKQFVASLLLRGFANKLLAALVLHSMAAHTASALKGMPTAGEGRCLLTMTDNMVLAMLR